MAITDQTAAQLLTQLESGHVSATQVCQAYLDRISAIDPRVGAFTHVDPEAVLSKARSIDQRRAAGTKLGRLAGVPVAVKDLLCTRGQATTCGSKILATFRPPYDATVVTRLQAADAIILGKTNLDEFAMGGSTETSAAGPTHNPWNLGCVPGGSSGGSAAGVAARLAPLAIGTDTGGSIRQPAAFCGIVGLKPTYGRVSRFGLIAFASSLDQIGPMAATVADVALLLEAVAGHDPRDATSAPIEVPSYSQTVHEPLAGLRLGRVPEHFGEGLDAQVAEAVEAAIETYRGLGATVVDVSMPHSRYGIATYYIIAPCEASSNLARYDGVHYGYRTDERALMAELKRDREAAIQAGQDTTGQLDSLLVRMYRRTRAEGFGAEVKRRIMLGTYALSAGYYEAYYSKALQVRRLIRRDYDAAFEEVDFLVGPVTPTPAFQLGERLADPLSMYLGDLYTVPANLAGVAGISLPCGFSADGLPIGVQLQARPFDEQRLLQAAHMFQEATDWHTRRAPLS